MERPKRVAIYSRVSTGEQEAENQLRQLRAFAEVQQWSVTNVFTDVASGGSPARAQFNAMMLAASQRKFDVLLFWSLDRLTREGAGKTLAYLQQLEAWGVGFRSFTEPYLDTLGIFKDAILALLATLAKQERLRISDRTKAGLERARAAGQRLGRPAVKASIAAQAQELRRQDCSYRQIAETLGIGKATAHRLAAG